MRDERVTVNWDFDSMPKFATSEARYAIGIAHTQGEHVLRAALVRALGRGRDMVCDAIDFASVDIDAHCSEFLSEFIDVSELDFPDFLFWQDELAEISAALVQPLIFRARRDFQEPLVIGVHDLGVWTELDERRRYQPICNPIVLAERAGITIIDDYPGKDLAHGGRGGPVSAVTDWILFGDRSAIPGQRNRIILHVGPTLRASVIPNRTCCQSQGIAAFDVGIGTSLFEGIRQQFGDSLFKETFDSVGRMQSLANNTVVDQWMDLVEPRRWSPERYSSKALVEVLPNSLTDSGELFATVMSFFAEQVANGLAIFSPKSMPSQELYIVGEYSSDGYFQNRLRHCLHDMDVRAAHVSNRHSLAIGAAVASLLRIDNEPANSTQQTGTEVPRPLGRITPGRPANWQAVLDLTTSKAHVPLRAAV